MSGLTAACFVVRDRFRKTIRSCLSEWLFEPAEYRVSTRSAAERAVEVTARTLSAEIKLRRFRPGTRCAATGTRATRGGPSARRARIDLASYDRSSEGFEDPWYKEHGVLG